MKMLSGGVFSNNVEQYIGRYLRSIVEQDLNDMKIIVVNDGSSNGNLEIV